MTGSRGRLPYRPPVCKSLRWSSGAYCRAFPHPAQNRDPAGLPIWQRGQIVCAGAGGGGIFTVTWAVGGWPHPGTAIPNEAAMAAACMALNSRTRPGMKKHSMTPRIVGIPDQNRQQ